MKNINWTGWPALPFFIFAGISVFGSMVVFKMKETSGTPLTDEINLQKDKPSGKNIESGDQQAKWFSVGKTQVSAKFVNTVLMT